MPAIVQKAGVASELRDQAMAVVFQLLMDVPDGELGRMRDDHFVEKLELEIEKIEKKAERKKAKLAGPEQLGNGFGLGWAGAVPLGVGMGGMGMAGVGMGGMGMAGAGLGGIIGGYGGQQSKKGMGGRMVACYLCGSEAHRVESCSLNTARWPYYVIQRLQREGKSTQQILEAMAKEKEARGLVPYQQQGGGAGNR